MLKKTDRLIEKYKDKKAVPKKLSVKFALPDVWKIISYSFYYSINV